MEKNSGVKILFVDGTKGFSPDRLKNKPCGGIITSMTLIPRYLMNQGYDVYVLSTDYKLKVTVNGIKYIKSVSDVEPDIVVFNRNIISNAMCEFYRESKKVWWLHDIVDYRYLDDDGFKKADRVVALSGYCASSYSDFYGAKKGSYTIIPNGVDETIYYPPTKKRNKNLYIVASAPIKGLAPLPYTIHNLKRANPDVEVRIYSSQKLHDMENTAKMESQLATLKEAGATICDPISQRDLADVMREAWALLMPNQYPEICSNLLLQALACGTPTVTVPIGSQPEYIIHEKNGLCTSTFPHDQYWWFKDFALQTMRLSADEKLHEKICKNAPKNIPTWSEIGDKWLKMLRRL